MQKNIIGRVLILVSVFYGNLMAVEWSPKKKVIALQKTLARKEDVDEKEQKAGRTFFVPQKTFFCELFYLKALSPCCSHSSLCYLASGDDHGVSRIDSERVYSPGSNRIVWYTGHPYEEVYQVVPQKQKTCLLGISPRGTFIAWKNDDICSIFNTQDGVERSFVAGKCSKACFPENEKWLAMYRPNSIVICDLEKTKLNASLMTTTHKLKTHTHITSLKTNKRGDILVGFIPKSDEVVLWKMPLDKNEPDYVKYGSRLKLHSWRCLDFLPCGNKLLVAFKQGSIAVCDTTVAMPKFQWVRNLQVPVGSFINEIAFFGKYTVAIVRDNSSVFSPIQLLIEEGGKQPNDGLVTRFELIDAESVTMSGSDDLLFVKGYGVVNVYKISEIVSSLGFQSRLDGSGKTNDGNWYYAKK